MRFVKFTRVKAELKYLGLRISKSGLSVLDSEVQKLIAESARVCKMDHRRTINAQHFYMIQTLKSLVRK